MISVMLVVLWLGYVHCEDKKLVVMDVDPGIDDALAILTILGDPSVTVVGITCVRGNAEVPQVVYNLYKILNVACRLEIPVYSGHNYGIITSPQGDHWFGQDGFGDLGDELEYDANWVSRMQTEHATAFLARIVSEKPGQITVLAIGPLTNIALALELNPKFLNQARKVMIMGGSIKGNGNIALGIEFNFHTDPDAAAVVLDRASISETDVILLPMETAEECDLGMTWRLDEFSSLNITATAFLDKLEGKYRKMRPTEAKTYVPIDTYVAVALLNPRSIEKTEKLYGLVETSGRVTRGLLLLDHLHRLGKPSNLEIITSLSDSEIRATIINSLSTYKKCIK